MNIYKNISLKLILIFLTISIFSSCGIFKKNLKTDTHINEELKTISEKLNSNNLQYKTFYSGFTGNFIQDKKTISLRGILKIKKDTFIQISIRPALGIELAKILFTNDSIKYLDKMKNQFFIEDYNFFKKKFGVEINYKILQSILTNKFFTYPPEQNIFSYKSELLKDSSYILSLKTKKLGKNINHTVKIAQNNFFVKYNNLSLSDKHTFVNILYSDFYNLENSKFPKKIKIKLSENEIKSEINISYKNISINKSLNSKFVIPKDYKRIKFD